MFGLKLPAVAAAGAVAVLAVGGMSGLPGRAVADDGGAGPGSSSSSNSASPPGSSSSDEDGGMDISPRTVAPGGVVSLHLSTSCTSGKKAKASADVFVDTVTLAPSGDGDGMDGNAFIKSDAADGSYSVSVQCDGGSASAKASITVSSDGSDSGSDSGSGSGSDFGSAAGSGSDFGSGSGSDPGSDPGSDSGSGPDSGSDLGSGAGSGSDGGALPVDPARPLRPVPAGGGEIGRASCRERV